MKGRKLRNEVRVLVDDAGCELTERSAIRWTFVDYFMNIYRAAPGDSVHHQISVMLNDRVVWALINLPRKLSPQDCNDLLQPFTNDEIRKAFFDMGGLKYPGPDGIPACFYKKMWPHIGDLVTTAVHESLSSR